MHVASAEARIAFVPSRDALAGDVDGMLIVLDLRTETFSILDHVATTMWKLLVELGDRARVLERLRSMYDADEERLARDLDAFADCMTAGGFAAWSAGARSDEPGAVRSRRRVAAGPALAARAWWTLLCTAWRLRHGGFAATYRAAQDASSAAAAASGADVDAVLARGLRAFARAENLCVLRRAPRDCFPRSIALFRFLRSLGIPVEHRIGVSRFPFRAHAWVECDGRVLADHPGQTSLFTAIARMT